MSKIVFSYPGGKARYASWIIDHFPGHELYVEPFGGSAAVLVNKEPSINEVYNDLNGDLVDFFTTLRDRTDDLIEWLRATPYSRELHERYATDYYDGHRPDDPIERAGRFFYLRYSQWGAKIYCKQPFSASRNARGYPSDSRARRFADAIEQLPDFADRFATVTIESQSYDECVDFYDTPDTLFYFDPPYVDSHLDNTYYDFDGDFDHGAFIDTLTEIDGRFVLSYETPPDGIPDAWYVATKETSYTMPKGQSDVKSATERLYMNFDPDAADPFDRNTSVQDFM